MTVSTNCNPSQNHIQDSSRRIGAGNWQKSADNPTIFLCFRNGVMLMQGPFKNIHVYLSEKEVQVPSFQVSKKQNLAP